MLLVEPDVRESTTTIPIGGYASSGFYLENNHEVEMIISVEGNDKKTTVSIEDPNGDKEDKLKQKDAKNYSFTYKPSISGIYFVTLNHESGSSDKYATIVVKDKTDPAFSSLIPLKSYFELTGGILLGAAVPYFYELRRKPHKYD